MITVTDNAREKIIDVLEADGLNTLRVGLHGGGCSGFSYFFSVEGEDSDDDIRIPINETISLVVDSMSNMYLDGSTIDYKKDLMGESFVFINPNQTSSCGCGSSVGFD